MQQATNYANKPWRVVKPPPLCMQAASCMRMILCNLYHTKKGATIETIQNWALGNPYLSNNTLDKILDGTSTNALAKRKAQDEAWEVEGKIFEILLVLAGGELIELAELGDAALYVKHYGKELGEFYSDAARVANYLVRSK